MPAASVNITLLDGALGVMPSAISGHVGVVVGPASSGPLLTPAAFVRPTDIVSNFGAGPLVEEAATILARTGKPLIVVRSDTTTDGAYTTVDVTGVTGTSVVTTDAATKPYGEYEPHIEVVTGGTIGVSGITYKWSLDGGRTQSAETSLGTANTITLADGNVKFALAAGTLVAGDIWFCRTTPPAENASDFSDAMTCVGEIGLPWDFVRFATAVGGSQAGTIDTWLEALWAAGIHKAARVHARTPTVGESETAYRASLQSDFSAVGSKRMTVTAGYAEFASGVSGRLYRSPAGRITACRALSKSIKPWRNDLGQVDLGSVGSDVRIRDTSGNRKSGLHDEALDPGLDALKFETLTTLLGYGLAAYVTTPRVMSALGSDYYLWQYVAVTNRAADAAQTYLIARCRKPIFVDPTTGYITDAEARSIERGVNTAVRNAVGDSVSGLSFAVGRTDNLLAQNALVTGDLRIIPLAYPAGYDITMGFVNPATGIPLAA